MSDEPPIEALKALAHPARFRILETLADAERNVGDIEEASGIGQPALSQQLAVLRNAGLVMTRKEAKLVYYSLERDRITALGEALTDLAGDKAFSAPPKRRSNPGVANFARLSD